jgi:hypothetical protein
MQWDYGEGPVVCGVQAVLFCAWLASSRFRVVVPLRDQTMASVVIGLDRTLRYIDGVPSYALTDNEKTVTVEHVCGIAVRNPTIVDVSRHYGLTIATCEPADPQSKGGSEAAVRVAKADLVPTDHNLRDEYEDWPALERACESFMADVNARPHRATRPWCCWARSTSICTGCRGCRTRCASGRRARSTAKRRSASATRSTRCRTS